MESPTEPLEGMRGAGIKKEVHMRKGFYKIKRWLRDFFRGNKPLPTPEPDPEPIEDPYLVEPILMLTASDVPYVADLATILSLPNKIKERFEEGSIWWKEQTGKTFRVGAVKVFKSARTKDQLEVEFQHPNDIWKTLQREAHEAGVIDNTDDHKAHYAIIPFIAAGGGMVGSENYGADYILPGKACTSGKEACILLGLDPGKYGFEEYMPMPWWYDEVREATGAKMHELGHVFGNGVDEPLHHKDNTIMFAYWDYPNIGIDLEQQDILDGSPFLE